MGFPLLRGCTSIWNDFPTAAQFVPLKQGESDVSAGETMLKAQEKNSWRHDAHGAFTPMQVVYGGGSSSTFAEGDFSWVGMERDERRSPSQMTSFI